MPPKKNGRETKNYVEYMGVKVDKWDWHNLEGWKLQIEATVLHEHGLVNRHQALTGNVARPMLNGSPLGGEGQEKAVEALLKFQPQGDHYETDEGLDDAYVWTRCGKGKVVIKRSSKVRPTDKVGLEAFREDGQPIGRRPSEHEIAIEATADQADQPAKQETRRPKVSAPKASKLVPSESKIAGTKRAQSFDEETEARFEARSAEKTAGGSATKKRKNDLDRHPKKRYKEPAWETFPDERPTKKRKIGKVEKGQDGIRGVSLLADADKVMDGPKMPKSILQRPLVFQTAESIKKDRHDFHRNATAEDIARVEARAELLRQQAIDATSPLASPETGPANTNTAIPTLSLASTSLVIPPFKASPRTRKILPLVDELVVQSHFQAQMAAGGEGQARKEAKEPAKGREKCSKASAPHQGSAVPPLKTAPAIAEGSAPGKEATESAKKRGRPKKSSVPTQDSSMPPLKIAPGAPEGSAPRKEFKMPAKKRGRPKNSSVPADSLVMPPPALPSHSETTSKPRKESAKDVNGSRIGAQVEDKGMKSSPPPTLPPLSAKTGKPRQKSAMEVDQSRIDVQEEEKGVFEPRKKQKRFILKLKNSRKGKEPSST